MMNLIEEAKRQIDGLIRGAYAAAAETGALNAGAEMRGNVEIPRDTANGDYAANHAMTAAKALRAAPRKIAEALIAHMDLGGSWFDSVEAAGPGFLNFRLGAGWYADVLRAVAAEGADYGRSDAMAGQKIMVEFVSANPTGPMHMGNARGGVLGDALAELLSRAGAEVWREFYVNDAGNQIEKFASSIDARYAQLLLGEDAVAFPEDGYHGDDIRELAEAFRRENGDGWLEKPEAERHAAMARFGLDRNLPKMERDLERYGIRYDRWFLESGLHSSGFVAETVAKLGELGYTYEKDGAVWLATSRILGGKLLREGKKPEEIEKLGLKDDVLRRANGFYTYFAADIAYHRDKLEVRGFDRTIDVWGADHHGHVARLKGALDALGLDGEHRLNIVLMQLVRLMRDGEVVRMSKRTGKAISLSDLLDEIPVDAARWFFNARPDTQMDFDLGLAVRQDSENPVYYVQYAHARICTMISALAEEGLAVPAPEETDFSLLDSPYERELIKTLAALPEEIRLAARDYNPNRISGYVTELASRFHRFYTECRIRGAERPLALARLLLADCTRQAIENALSILGVSAPERM
ncbi:MAG: arginine--tRNA ligase [Oscillospiraceae bacterium]|nr:arginine--tRNA ligase [Oscillospiraceae bacterium]